MVDLLLRYFLLDIQEASILLCTGLALFRLPIKKDWKRILLCAAVVGVWGEILTHWEVDYQLKVMLFNALIMGCWLWFGHRLRVIAMFLVGLGWMVSTEAVLVYILQSLGIDLAVFGGSTFSRLVLSYLYLATLAIPYAIFGLFKFDLSKLWPRTIYNRYLVLLIVMGSITVVTLLMLNSAVLLENILPEEIKLPAKHFWVYHLIALIFALCASCLFWLYLKATIVRVEIETEAPYSKQLTDLTTAVRSIKHDILSHHTVILGYLKMREYGKIEEYVMSLVAETKQVIDVTEGIRNKTVSALLYGKMTQFTKEGVDVQVKVSPNAPQLESWKDIDVSKLLGNLLDNAFTATLATNEEDDDRYIRLEWGMRSGKEYLYVENTGPTIPEEVMPHLFDLGYTTRESGEGGVGLAVVKGLVTKYKGEIDVISRHGVTRFTLTLPVAEKGVQKPLEQETASA